MNCPTCRKELEPATLRPKNLWCTICAVEFDPHGNPLDASPGPAKELVPVAVSAPAILQPPPANARNELIRTFRVTIGGVSFVASGRTELEVAGTKLVIEPL